MGAGPQHQFPKVRDDLLRLRHVKPSARKHEVYLSIHINECEAVGLGHFTHLKSESRNWKMETGKWKLETGVALPKKVKQQMVCHPEGSEGSLQLFSPRNCGDASLRSA